jgi:acyl-CoA reductase-like NAD-dependent aldehyde dehydrogenase
MSTSRQHLTVTSPPTYQYYANGQWLDAAGGRTFEDVEPYSGRLFARVAACGREEARRTIAAASAAFPAWAATPPAERARLFFAAADIVRRRRQEIAELLARETGSTILFASFQQDLVIQTLEQAAGWVYLPRGEVLQTNIAGSHSISVRRPLGVIASFTPWNGASILSWRAALSPLVAGNTVVIKPSELAPVSAGLILAEVAHEAGFPPGVINVMTHAPGEASVFADEVFENGAVRCINLIGGVGTARILAERAGRALKRTVLELGGYNPMIVLDDTDIDYAVNTAIFGAFFHQGQICLNTRKIIVQTSLYQEFLSKFIARAKTLPAGDPQDPKTIIGPLISEAAVAQVHHRVQEARAQGATLHLGGTYEGQVYAPTILTDVPYAATMSNEETFGPVVIVQSAASDDEAIEIANRVNYGLTSSILTGNPYRGFELAPRVLAGIVNVNSSTINDEIHAPMGGVRDSGWGRTGPGSIADFTDLVWINVRSTPRQYPF